MLLMSTTEYVFMEKIIPELIKYIYSFLTNPLGIK